MKGWKFALIPALLLGGGLLSGCGNQGNQGNQNPSLTNEEVKALVAPLHIYALQSLMYALQSMGYVPQTYTPPENQPSAEIQSSFSYSGSQPCPYEGYVTFQITSSPNSSYTEATLSGSAVANRCGVTPELTYESGTNSFWGLVKIQGNIVEFYVKEQITATAIFRGQNYSIQGNLEGGVQFTIPMSGSGIIPVPLKGTLYINGKPYMFEWP